MKKLKIEDLIPSESTFHIKEASKTFKLDPCTPGKMLRIGKMFNQNIEEMLANATLENICKIALGLMNMDDLEYFKKQEIKTIDISTGEEKIEARGGYTILCDLISSIKEMYEVYAAILISFGMDKEEIDNFLKKIKDGINDEMNDQIKKKSL